MKTFAIYDKTGKIKKVISTTRDDIIGKNTPEDCRYMEVDSNVKTNSHQIIDGEAEINKIVKSNVLKILTKFRMKLKK